MQKEKKAENTIQGISTFNRDPEKAAFKRENHKSGQRFTTNAQGKN